MFGVQRIVQPWKLKFFYMLQINSRWCLIKNNLSHEDLSACSWQIPKFVPVGLSALIRDNLHWLPAVQRINFKILQLVTNCIHQRAPLYLQELVCWFPQYWGIDTWRSDDQFCLVVNRCRLSLMQRRGFAVAGLLAWNDLPGVEGRDFPVEVRVYQGSMLSPLLSIIDWEFGPCGFKIRKNSWIFYFF